MKKLLLLGFTFLLSIFSVNLQHKLFRMLPLLHQYYVLEILQQNIQVNQTSPPTVLKVIVGYDIFEIYTNNIYK